MSKKNSNQPTATNVVVATSTNVATQPIAERVGTFLGWAGAGLMTNGEKLVATAQVQGPIVANRTGVIAGQVANEVKEQAASFWGGLMKGFEANRK